MQIEILEHEFNAALNVERVNFPTMDGASRSGVQARAAYAASLEEQRLDTLGAIARALRRANLRKRQRSGAGTGGFEKVSEFSQAYKTNVSSMKLERHEKWNV